MERRKSLSLWVFGYGSLMWNPGFPHFGATRAVMRGVHRALCVYSHVHRGTPDRPGLVFGLDRGGACVGIAFQVSPADRESTLAYLRAREQVTSVYLEVVRPVVLEGGERVEALTYVVDRGHGQYAGRLPPALQLDLVRGATGRSGPNPAYVLATAEHLKALAIRDPVVEALAVALTAPSPRPEAP